MHAHVHPALLALALRRRDAFTKPPPSAQAEAERDPVLRFPKFLIDEGVLDRHMLQRITHEIDEEVHDATHQALHARSRRRRKRRWRTSIPRRVDPTSDALSTPSRSFAARR